MPRSRKSYNKGYKVLPLDAAKPFSKVGENPSKKNAQATAMMKTQFKISPKGNAKLTAPRGM
jgi:hypothetical protein